MIAWSSCSRSRRSRSSAARGSTKTAANVAFQRGPLVYCVEGIDNPEVPVLDAIVDPAVPVQAAFDPGLLGGVAMLSMPGLVPIDTGPLYRRWRPGSPPAQPVTLKAIPYYAWNNRGIAPMTVWLQRR